MAQEQGEEALGPAPKEPHGEVSPLWFSTVLDLDSPAVTTEGWEGEGRFFISPELVPQGPKSVDLALQMEFISVADLSFHESFVVSLSSGCLVRTTGITATSR